MDRGSDHFHGFPGHAGAVQSKLNRAGSSDLFITHVNSLGKQLLYSTYLGGPGERAGFRPGTGCRRECLCRWRDLLDRFSWKFRDPRRSWNWVCFEIIRIVCRLVPAAPSQWTDHGGQSRVGHSGKRHSHRDNERDPLPDDSRRLSAMCSNRRHRGSSPVLRSDCSVGWRR